MLKKLNLRERIKFWCKYKIWLRKVKNYTIDEKKCGMIFYESKNQDTLWGVTESSGKITKRHQKVNIFPITEKGDSYYWCNNYYMIYDDIKQTGYILGTKGIFNTSRGAAGWNRIYKASNNVTGMLANLNMNIVFVLEANGKDRIYRITDLQEEPIVEGEIVLVNGESINKSRVGFIIDEKKAFEVLIKNEDDTYSLYILSKNETYDPKVKFTNLEEYTNFSSHELATAFLENKPGQALITLVDGEVKVHYYCNKLEALEDNYYFAYLHYDNNAHLLKYINVNEIKDLGIMPMNGILSKTENVLGTDFFKIKQNKGITLISVTPNNVMKTKFYENAVDIKFAEPILFENGNVMEIKPLAVYEKLIEN